MNPQIEEPRYVEFFGGSPRTLIEVKGEGDEPPAGGTEDGETNVFGVY